MSASQFVCRWGLFCAIILVAAIGVSPVRAQSITDDMVGQDARAWATWQQAMRALERDDKAESERLLSAVAALNLSDLRLELMAQRTGALRLEQWARDADAPPIIRAVADKMMAGRRQRILAEDGWHYAAIGRFEWADAQFKALADSSPDSVALLELSRQNPNRHLILVKLLMNTEVGPSARRFLEILNNGEEMLRTDANEIAENVRKLAGPPRMAYNATSRLKASGEYAVPHLVQFLQDADFAALHPKIIEVLPQLGRDGLNPMVIALGMQDDVTRQILIDAMAKIGYRQVLPYLSKIANDPDAAAEVRDAARDAMAIIGATTADTAALFLELAEGYWDNAESLQADPRRDQANVWYLRDGELRLVQVPRAVFNDIMAMRACEEALIANPDTLAAAALWLASNYRREAELGLNVESDRPDPLADRDGTRPDGYPRSIYFGRAAGAKYNHMVLARANTDREPGVALGAIAALSETAGGPSLITAEDMQQPLVQALSFPNRQVRIKAALALGRALPQASFVGAQNVIPVLNEALAQAGIRTAMVVDADLDTANRFKALLRAVGYEVAVGTNLNQAREDGRQMNISSYDVVLLSTNIENPGTTAAVDELRRDFQTAATPILVVAEGGRLTAATALARGRKGVEVLLVDVLELGDPQRIAGQVDNKIDAAAQSLGMTALGADLSLGLALQAADVLRNIAENNSPVFDFSRATGALITALGHPVEALRVRAAHALALASSRDAQVALVETGLLTERSQAERVNAFDALAESARTHGNLLGDSELIGKLIDFTMQAEDLILRAAASKALGALDLPSNKASEIIRAQHAG